VKTPQARTALQRDEAAGLACRGRDGGRGPGGRPNTLPAWVLTDAALVGSDPRLRMMARALELITAVVPTAGAVFYPIDGRAGRHGAGPMLVKTDRDAPNREMIVREYFTRYHAYDPFCSRTHAHNNTPIVGVGELGGLNNFARTVWASEYLAEWGIATETVIFLRNAGRIAAGISLSRRHDAPLFTQTELMLLHRIQPMVEDAWALSGNEPTKFEHEERLAGRGLTARELEIARRAAAGAHNDEIARALIISPDTVKTHLKRVFVKLGVRNRVQLAHMLGPETYGPARID
jgi:DNA-binding CsgD family transcriptional regulator